MNRLHLVGLLLIPLAVRAQDTASTKPTVWEYATVRATGSYSIRNGPGAMPSMSYVICRSGQQTCVKREIESEREADEAGLVKLLNALGQEGFEVTAVVQQTSDARGMVLLKRKVPAP